MTPLALQPARAIDRPAALGALLLVATVTEAMFLLLPSFVGALGDDLHLSTTRTGLLASADLTGIASPELMQKVTRGADYRQWTKDFLGGE